MKHTFSMADLALIRLAFAQAYLSVEHDALIEEAGPQLAPTQEEVAACGIEVQPRGGFALKPELGISDLDGTLAHLAQYEAERDVTPRMIEAVLAGLRGVPAWAPDARPYVRALHNAMGKLQDEAEASAIWERLPEEQRAALLGKGV